MINTDILQTTRGNITEKTKNSNSHNQGVDSLPIFADVILPLYLSKAYTYKIPDELCDRVAPGMRVEVQFGKSKLYSAIVKKIHKNSPNHYNPKNILSILDETPIVNPIQLKHWEWIGNYYLCSEGEVLNAALPSGLKLSSEKNIIINPGFGNDYTQLSDKEYLIAEALEIQRSLNLEEISDILNQKNVLPVIKSLLNKKVVLIEEDMKQKYTPKFATYVRLNKEFCNETAIKQLFSELEKKQKQLELLMTYIHLNDVNYKTNNYQNFKPIPKNELLKTSKSGEASLKTLAGKNILDIFKKEIGRIEDGDEQFLTDVKLSPLQLNALKSINELLKTKPIVLLHGETGSGKTEIYIQLIEQTLKAGQQALYLLPEIALTTQIIGRLKKRFGNKIGVYHSKFNDNERVEVWKNILNKKYSIVLGTRSACFLPFDNLGLVIIDEEYENTYKQAEPAPRYNARETSIYLAQLHRAKTILGSATPSFESYFNAQTGKYGIVRLTERYSGVKMPEIIIANIKEEKKKKMMPSHFSSLLINKLSDLLAKKEQAILFQNRRGYNSLWECDTCGWVPKCKNCDVSLTFHKQIYQLKCHYCGYSYQPSSSCLACGNHNIKMHGFGTEKIEDELSVIFPDAKIARLDLDSTRAKHSFQQILSDFEEQKADILVGTQMVTKGLDFDNVSLVGILSADSLLNYPDFRAFERAFQLMTQVSGRAGRKDKQGLVIIQTYQPEHPIVNNVVRNEYEDMYNSQIKEREKFKYPPFVRLIKITLKHKELDIIDPAASELKNILNSNFGNRILGPEFPPVMRIRNQYIKNILLKIEKTDSLSRTKEILLEKLNKFKDEKPFRSVKIIVDVDP